VEQDLQITVKGMNDELALNIGYAIASVLSALEGPLHFRRMHRVIATAEFGAELKELSTATASGNAIIHTNEDYAIAVAKVLLIPCDTEIEPLCRSPKIRNQKLLSGSCTCFITSFVTLMMKTKNSTRFLMLASPSIHGQGNI
jgi:hypothetical protein